MAAPILSISFQTLSLSERQFPGLHIECLIMAINNLSKMCCKCELPFRVAGKPTEYFDDFYDSLLCSGNRVNVPAGSGTAQTGRYPKGLDSPAASGYCSSFAPHSERPLQSRQSGARWRKAGSFAPTGPLVRFGISSRIPEPLPQDPPRYAAERSDHRSYREVGCAILMGMKSELDLERQ
jgi:hypothetical protein